MRIITEKNLCADRPYINLKKLPSKTSLRVGSITEAGFKSTYIINQNTQSLASNKNFTLEINKGIEKVTLNTDLLDNHLLVEVNYSTRGGNKSNKFKVYFILHNIKYALPYSSFEDIYDNCMNILDKEVNEKEELNCIRQCFNNLENDEINVDMDLNLERLKEFKDKVDYKRNVDYFVINNITSATSKYDINAKTEEIEAGDNLTVLRYNYNTRHYHIVEPSKGTGMIDLKDTDIICDFTSNDFPTVSIYTYYGFGKLLDIKNNVIPNTNTISLFANILDLGLEVLG